MRTTLDIDAPVLKQVKALQKRSRKSLGSLVSELLADSLKQHRMLAWLTVMRYVRMATHPRIFTVPLSQVETDRNVEQLISSPRVLMMGEEDGFWDIYREVAGQMPVRGNLVADAHLAALLKQQGVLKLYSHDRD